jgi:hypothetical protein
MTEEQKENKAIPSSEFEQKYQKERERAQRFQGELTDLEKRVEAYSKYGDIDTINGKLQELEALKREKAGKSDEDLDKLINERLLDAQKAIEDRDRKLQELSSELHETKVVSKAWDVISNEFTSDAGKLLKDKLRKDLTITADGQIAVKGNDGKPSFIDGVKLKTVIDYAEELKREYPSLVADKTIKGTLNKNGTTKTDLDYKILDFNNLKNLSPSEVREQARLRAEKELSK